MSLPLVLLAAIARNGAIGRGDGLPWRLPGDMRHFRSATMGRPVILGRKTWASIGRPLPGRFPVVVSRDPALDLPDGVARAADLEAALRSAEDLASRHGAGEVIVAGGATLYAALIGRADRLVVTEVDLEPAADTFFPAIDPRRWRETVRQPQPRTAGDEAAYAFVTYARR
ncbi:MAG TPA: dihydrofolate reductase [Lichenihabitans sp.]|jgi:dihydrofolate reductase|nr:dihydrofolate reductase [Lichenihabitans sp.]